MVMTTNEDMDKSDEGCERMHYYVVYGTGQLGILKEYKQTE